MILTERTILVTGVTGRGFAEAFHRLGNQVIIAERRKSLLDAVTQVNPGIHGIAVDPRHPAATAATSDEFEALFPDLELLVKNAGVSRSEAWDTQPVEIDDALAIIETDIVGVERLTATLLPMLKHQSAATIITTTSTRNSFRARPFRSIAPARPSFIRRCGTSCCARRSRSASSRSPMSKSSSRRQQASDPAAMPLNDYSAQVIDLLGKSTPPNGEILVERVKRPRTGERAGSYQQIYAALNAD